MFDFDASKLLIIGVVALIVIGPKDLPRVLRQVGQAVGKLRRMAAEFQGQFMDAMKEADLADLKVEVSKLKDSAKLDVVFNPVADVKSSLDEAVGSAASASAPLNPFGQTPIGEPLPEPAAAPGVAQPDPVVLEIAEAAHHTPATSAGAVHAVDAAESGRRRILVPKRRPPGDRLGRPAPAGRGRPFLPPRRDPR